MRQKFHRRRGHFLIPVLLAVVPAASAWSIRPAHAASGLQALISRAERNTNTVRTLVHRDQETETTPAGSLSVSATGTEDEARNRERDSESVTVINRVSGKLRKVHYTLDVVFLKGLTYYRSSTLGKSWHTHKGMTLADPYTGGGFKRGRTTAQFSKALRFHSLGTQGGETHARATLSQTGQVETVDVWITGGSKPYVIRYSDELHTTKAPRQSIRRTVSFVSFNKPVNIQAPVSGSSTSPAMRTGTTARLF